MRFLLLVLTYFLTLFSSSSLSQAETQTSSIVTFVNGEIADAEDINSNFDSHEQRLKAIEQYGGCSAAQDESNVVITCADGTSGILAGAGTVILYPEGAVGVVPPLIAPSAFVVMDANDVILGESTDLGPAFGVDLDDQHKAFIYNDAANKIVELYALKHTGGYVFFESDDCSGQVLTLDQNQRYLRYLSDWGYGLDASVSAVTILTRSFIFLEGFSTSQMSNTEQGPCEEGEAIRSVVPLVTYTPASEILNAAYPVRLEQIP